MSTRILLVDDHRLMLEGLRSLLEKERGLEVVGEAQDGRTAMKLANELKPDVVIMDVVMPGLNGIEATRHILAEQPRPKVIALSMYSYKRYVADMFRAGVSAYVLKDCALKELVAAIRAVCRGETYLTPTIARIVLDDYVNRLTTQDSSELSVLSAREREVLQLLAEGRNTKEIADCLNVSTKTVETHRRQIMERLGIYSIAELTKFAIRAGLTAIEC